MVNIYEIIKAWEAGEKTLEEANTELKGTGIYIDPKKNEIGEGTGAVVCEDVNKINGFAMIDTGTTTLDKVEIINGQLKDSIGDMFALVLIGDSMFEVVNGVNLKYKGEIKK